MLVCRRLWVVLFPSYSLKQPWFSFVVRFSCIVHCWMCSHSVILILHQTSLSHENVSLYKCTYVCINTSICWCTVLLLSGRVINVDEFNFSHFHSDFIKKIYTSIFNKRAFSIKMLTLCNYTYLLLVNLHFLHMCGTVYVYYRLYQLWISISPAPNWCSFIVLNICTTTIRNGLLWCWSSLPIWLSAYKIYLHTHICTYINVRIWYILHMHWNSETFCSRLVLLAVS